MDFVEGFVQKLINTVKLNEQKNIFFNRDQDHLSRA